LSTSSAAAGLSFRNVATLSRRAGRLLGLGLPNPLPPPPLPFKPLPLLPSVAVAVWPLEAAWVPAALFGRYRVALSTCGGAWWTLKLTGRPRPSQTRYPPCSLDTSFLKLVT
jgi:hypothetical protein